MNVWGKVLAFLVIVAAALSTYFTAKLIQVRNSWTKKSQTFVKSYEADEKQLHELQAQFLKVQTDTETALRSWGRTWAADTQIASPAEGRLQIVAGTGQGLADKQVIHGFELQQDGSSIYRGPFIVATAQADRSALVPTWRVRPQDVVNWKPGQWRWRGFVPTAYSDRFDDQLLAFAKGDETLGDRRAAVAIQDRLIAEAQQQLKFRVAELVGGDELPKDEVLSAEFREGLVKPMEETEDRRNAVLLEIAELRAQVRASRDAVERLQAENLQLTQRLPQPPAAAVSRRD
ncbi:MAG TPA: hypothetical protein VM165_23680 [Planctomycetaceae bacterium]|nr:hypothetical protein [Planctomycetaceae bacterium]